MEEHSLTNTPVTADRIAELILWHSVAAVDRSDFQSAGRSDDVVRALRELAALRRPVVQSAQFDEIRSRQQARKDFISGGPVCSMGPEFTIGTITDDTDVLLSALDQAQRENRRLADRVDQFEAVPGMQQMEFIRAELNDAKRFAFADHPLQPSMAKTVLACADQLLAAYNERSREIARLSSPPEERREMNMPALLTASFHQGEWCLMTTAGDVVELVEDDEYCGYAESEAMRDTLIQDLRRYSNAHKILLAERDEARGKVSKMDTTLGAYINRERNLIAAAERNKDLHCLAEAELREAQKRIERLEGALKALRSPAERISSILYGSTARHCGMHMIHSVQIDAQLAKELGVALAAADGQQDKCSDPDPCVSHLAYKALQAKVDAALMLVDRLAGDRTYCGGEFVDDIRRVLSGEDDDAQD